MSKPIVIITGPTASGKTALSFILAKKISAEIICADSMTVFRGMNIGTDKPYIGKKFEFKKDGTCIIDDVPHHLLDIKNPDEPFNISIYKDLASQKMNEIFKRGNIPLIVGGSTLYIDSLIYGYEMPQVAPDENLRSKLEKETSEELFKELVKIDPDAEWTIDKHNKRRIVRALEVTIKTGLPFSKQKSKKALPQNVLYLAVDRNRTALYDNINQRVDEMIKAGFIDEVKALVKKYDHNTAMQAAGYRQLTQYLDSRLSLMEAIEKTKQVHRNYAKRQLTWLKKNQDIIWIKDASSAQKIIEDFI